MNTTPKANPSFRVLRELLYQMDTTTMASIRSRGLRILAEIGEPVRHRLAEYLRDGSPGETLEPNLAVAYVDLLLVGREPRAAWPLRGDHDHPAEPGELLTEAFLAVIDRDIAAYRRALHDLTALADRGMMLAATDLETAR